MRIPGQTFQGLPDPQRWRLLVATSFADGAGSMAAIVPYFASLRSVSRVRVTGPCSIWPGGCLSACVRRSICRFQNAFLEQVLPGFKWLSWLTFALGLVENFLYGVYAGLAYVPVYNFLRRRWGD